MTFTLTRTRRFSLLTGLAALGALLFVPFLQASAPEPLHRAVTLSFVVTSTAVAAIATWLGLGWADRAALPMPLLRAFETHTPLSVNRLALACTLPAGAVLGLLGLAALRHLHLPAGPAALWVRIGSAGFAAITLESVLHLAIMSGVVRATRRVGLGLGVATLAYIVFHLATLGGQPPTVVATVGAVNGLAGLVFGLLYARFGFEYLVVAHFLAHAITVGLA